MPLQVQPLTEEDLDTLVQHTFAGDATPGDDLVPPPYALSWPVSTAQQAQLRAQCHFATQLDRLRNDKSLHFVKVVDTDDQADILAVGRWHYYEHGYDYEREKHWEMAPDTIPDDSIALPAGTSYPPSDFNRVYHNQILGSRDAFRPRWVPTDGPAWILMHLVTRPRHRRRGAAGLIVRWGQEQAAKTGCGGYLEAGVQGAPLYAKFGFEPVGEPERIDLRGFGGAVKEFVMLNMKWSAQKE